MEWLHSQSLSKCGKGSLLLTASISAASERVTVLMIGQMTHPPGGKRVYFFLRLHSA